MHQKAIGRIQLVDGMLDLELWGRLDHRRHVQLRRVLRFVVAHSEQCLRLDLRSVTSMEPGLIRSVAAAVARLQTRGVEIDVVPPDMIDAIAAGPAWSNLQRLSSARPSSP